MKKETTPEDFRKNLRLTLFKSLIVPALVLVFFIVAPRWLNSKLHSEVTLADLKAAAKDWGFEWQPEELAASNRMPKC